MHKLVVIVVAAVLFISGLLWMRDAAENIGAGYGKDLSTMISDPNSLASKKIDEKNPMRGILNPETGLFSNTGKAIVKEQEKVSSSIESFMYVVLGLILTVILVAGFMFLRKDGSSRQWR